MSDVIVLPCPDGWIALSRDVYAQALQDARDAGWRVKTAENAAQTVAMPVAVPSTPANTLWTPEECAERSGTTRNWWIANARQGRIEATKVGRRWRFTPAQFDAALRRRSPELVTGAYNMRRSAANG